MSLDDDDVGQLLDRLDVELELNQVVPEIEPLLVALMEQAPRAALEQIASAVAEAIWDVDLERTLAAELQTLRDHTVVEDAALLSAIDAAQIELKRPPNRNAIALALIWRAALSLIRHANRNRERMAELEQTLARTPAAGHRLLALPMASAASLAADIGDEESARAIARYAFDLPRDRQDRRVDRATARLARTLATDGRREDVRSALAELAKLSAEEFPVSAEALEQLLSEPAPRDPARDELWVSLVVGLAHERLLHALDAEPSH